MAKLDWTIAPELRGTLSLSADASVSARYETLFIKATNLLAPTVKPKPIAVFFVRDVLKINLTAQEKIAEYWRDMIVYNLARMDLHHDEREVMVILLEELVHAYYDSLDKEYVGKIVAQVYPQVKFDAVKMQYVPNT